MKIPERVYLPLHPTENLCPVKNRETVWRMTGVRRNVWKIRKFVRTNGPMGSEC